MEKIIRVIHPQENLLFSFADREVKVSESMSVEDAEIIAAQYPGLYVEVIEKPKSKAVEVPKEAK